MRFALKSGLATASRSRYNAAVAEATSIHPAQLIRERA